MQHPPEIYFFPFHLDPANEQLWRGAQPISLRPKTFAVLCHLAQRPGQLVSHEELLNSIWPNTYVSHAVPTVCVREIRQALGDEARAPQYIQTVARRGYRFIGKIQENSQEVDTLPSQPMTALPTASISGREAELQQLQQGLAAALQGKRQVLFLTGEPGIGKTSLVETFLAAVSPEVCCTIMRGQCLESYGVGEAYHPVLEAVGRLCRDAQRELGQSGQSGRPGQSVFDCLAQYAPTWLAQLPWLAGVAHQSDTHSLSLDSTRERMPREMAEAIEVLARTRMLILLLEDLHWSDYSTLDLISYLAQRREPARLLLLGTYRSGDAAQEGHPLATISHTLQLHGQCKEIPLGLLSSEAIATYLSTRFEAGTHLPLQELADFLHKRTEGNPLFLVNIVDDFIARGWIQHEDSHWVLSPKLEDIELGVPENLRQMIEQRIDRLSDEERQFLEAAGVVGLDFTAAAVAAGVEKDVIALEEACAGLARRGQFVCQNGKSEWPDHTITARYAFSHALYRQVLYERITPSRRALLHLRIGKRQEYGYGSQTSTIAPELAVHFEQGRDYRRAVYYLRQAAENANRRGGYREALIHLTKGIQLLPSLPDTQERNEQELSLQITLSLPLTATKGEAAPEVERASSRAWDLCQKSGSTFQLFHVLAGRWSVHFARGELQIAHELAEELMQVVHKDPTNSLALSAYYVSGLTFYWMGDFSAASTALEHALPLSDQHQQHRLALDPTVVCLTHLAYIDWIFGYPDKSVQRMQAALNRANELSLPYNHAFILPYAAGLYQIRREWSATQQFAEQAIELCRREGFPQYLAMATIQRGVAIVGQGQGEAGLVEIQKGIEAYRATGAELGRPFYLAVLAGAYGEVGRAEEGLASLAEADTLANQGGQRGFRAGQLLIRGSLLLGQVPHRQREAEECFRQALDLSRHQSMKCLELQAAMSLGRLWQTSRKKKKAAQQLLSKIYASYTEGFDVADLQEAKALLDALA